MASFGRLRWLLNTQFTDIMLHHSWCCASHSSKCSLLFCFQCQFLSPQLKLRNYWLHQDGWRVFIPPGFKWAYSVIYVINWFWKPTCILYNPTLILLWNLPSISFQYINMTDWGHYLGNESLAAPPGVVEAFDEESQELSPDQLPPSDDRGPLSSQTCIPVWVWSGRWPTVLIIISTYVENRC